MGQDGPDYSNVAPNGKVNITHPMHASQHEDGGSDEINVGGLSGELADNQPSKAHASSHAEDAADEVDGADLGSGAAADGQVLTADGVGGSAWKTGIGVGFYNAYVCVRDKKTQNTSGGTFTSGEWRTRDINDEQADPSGICSISSNQIILVAGTYRCIISAPAQRVGRHQAILYNVTDDTTLLVGTSEWSNSAIVDYSATRSIIVGRFTLAATKTLEVRHQCQVTRANIGLGVEANFTDEIYTVAEFWKES